MPRAKHTGPLLHQAALLAGAVVFTLPFLWLVGSSAKTPEETYPPRWVPGVPPAVAQSPYLDARDDQLPVRPPKVSTGAWERALPLAREAIRARLADLAPDLPSFYAPFILDDTLVDVLLARVVRRTPDRVLEAGGPEAAEALAGAVDDALVREVFDTVYKRVAFGDIRFGGWDVFITEDPTETGLPPWEVTGGEAQLIHRDEGLRRAALELHYRFEDRDTVGVQAEVPLEMAPDMLKKFSVALHGDNSWHRVAPVLELAGRRYAGSQATWLGMDTWRDITWQFPSAADHSMRTRTWLLLRDEGASDFNAPGRARITIRIERAGPLTAAFNKYVNNYRDAVLMVPLLAYTRNSLVLVVLNVIGQVFGSALVAYAFARLRWPGREFCFVLILATLMIPPQVTMVPVFLVFKNLGWYNTLKPLWVPAFFGSAFFIFLLRQFMKGIPRDLEDSARIDGCGYLGIFSRIMLPLMKPALATVGIFTFMAVWNDFMGPLIYLNEQRLYPLSLGLFALKVFQGGNMGLMMAASVLMTVPIIVLFLVAQRHFIQGITLTGLKG